MIEPQGFQLSRRLGWRMPVNGVSVARPGPLGNPFLVASFGPAQAVALHRTWLEAPNAESLGYGGSDAEMLNHRRAVVMERLPALRGKHLGCWCAVPRPGERDVCHRVFLLELANG